jgi:chromosome segregation ATPase
MDAALISAIAGGTGIVLGALGGLLVNLRKAPAETKLLEAQASKAQKEADIANAQADREQAEANRMLQDNLRCEIERQKTESAALEQRIKTEADETEKRLLSRISELEGRLTKAETRATSAEVRLADSETRANEFRRAVIAVGDRLDRERAEFRETTEKLCVIIEHLLSCIGDPSKTSEVDSNAIERIIINIRERSGQPRP